MFKKEKAFTLIELLVVLAIIGILSGFVYAMMSGGINAAKDAKRKMDVDTIQKALLAMQIAGKPMPSTACTFGGGATPCSTIFTGASDITPYLPTTPIDPTPGSGYLYTPIGSSGDFEVSATLSNTYAYGYSSSDNQWFNEPSTGGTCGTDINLCSAGTLANASGSSPAWVWNCNGRRGGSTATCHAYTANNTLTVPAGNISLIVIGGGGGGAGGSCAGGGGGGSGYQSINNISVSSSTSLAITVGSGGAGGLYNGSGGAGSSSSVIGTGVSLTAAGADVTLRAPGSIDAMGPAGTGFCNGGQGGVCRDYNNTYGAVGGCAGAGGAGGPTGNWGGGGGGGARGYGTTVTATAGADGAGDDMTHIHGYGGGVGIGYGGGGGGGGGHGLGTPNYGGVGGVGGSGFVLIGY